MANRAGRTTGTTLVIPLRRGWAVWCRVLFAASRRFAFITAPLRRQSFIHMAHWSIVDDLGGNALGHTCLYFESNFDASMDEYVDVFVQALPWHMRLVWAGGVAYPGLYPSAAYRDWSDDHGNAIQHYYGAYAGATTTEVAAALRVSERLDRFEADAPYLDDEAFAAGYRRLLHEVGPWL
ncbi:MAG: hypothetical protein MUF83_05455 [Acidimicrobiales bacterium]|jgi:hypothetical protein|nr:hypothetical protein [Acidimicrobiales bacterium]